MLRDVTFARRAAGLPATFPAPHFPTELGEDVIAFDSGFACPQLLPDLTRFAVDALTTHRAETLQYSANQGQPELRSWIAEYMNKDGCAVTPDNVIVVNGAKHGIELLCKLFLDEGDAVVVTAPTYFSAIPIFASFGAEFVEAEQDENGLKVRELEVLLNARRDRGLKPPKLVYNVSDFHNPSGVAMSLERREALIDLAGRHGLIVLEDNPYRQVRFSGEHIPTLKALDRDGIVVHAGTFSKLIAPGLRIGWLAARQDLIARLIALKADGGSSALMQRIVYEFCSSADFPLHIARVQATYRERRDRMIAALRRYLPLVSFGVPEGGYYVWAELPAGIDGEVVARHAAQRGVNIIPGTKFFAAGRAYPSNSDKARSHIRLSYSYATLAEIDEGIGRLAEAVKAAAIA